MTCERFLSAIPTPAVFIAFAVGFVAGALVRSAWERHLINRPPKARTEDRMNERPLGMVWLENRPRLHALYMRYIAVVVALLFVTVACSAFGVVWLTFTRGNDNQHNSVVQCLNANESRRGSLALWTFLFGLTDPSTQTAQEKTDSAKIQDWIRKLYQLHDCSDLSRKYPIPPPPVLGNRT